MSQSPQIGSMFLTLSQIEVISPFGLRESRNPLKSGQCFLLFWAIFGLLFYSIKSRNPLKSGQCFLLLLPCQIQIWRSEMIESQSPQIGSMFLTNYNMARQGKIQKKGGSQSPQIGSMFLTESISKSISKLEKRRNPLKSGQCFLRGK